MNCITCGTNTSNPKFCSRSCAAKTNNLGVRKHGKGPKDCIFCGKKCKRSSSKFCSSACCGAFNNQKAWNSGKRSISTVRNYLLRTRSQKCEVCSYSQWNNQIIPLEVDHIDGNPYNNEEINLRLICPNCHAQTETYKGKNKGNGRIKRMKRYYEGKSY